jgi:flavodoxin
MNVGIIVYSRTGHTLSVAVKLEEALSAAGHTVNLAPVEAAGPVKPGATDVPLKTRPAIEGYDALVFAAPVWGGRPAPPMAAYLEQLPSMEGTQVACLVTGFFPPGLGRNQALARMTETCTAKGATLCGTGSVGWLSLNRKRQIARVVAGLSRRLCDD